MTSESVSTLFRLPVNVTSPSDNKTVIEGDSLNLTCNGEHFIHRQWTRVLDEDSISEVVSTSDDGRIEVTSDYQLLFWWTLPSDEAQYRCTHYRKNVVMRGFQATSNFVVTSRN